MTEKARRVLSWPIRFFADVKNIATVITVAGLLFGAGAAWTQQGAEINTLKAKCAANDVWKKEFMEEQRVRDEKILNTVKEGVETSKRTQEQIQYIRGGLDTVLRIIRR